MASATILLGPVAVGNAQEANSQDDFHGERTEFASTAQTAGNLVASQVVTAPALPETTAPPEMVPVEVADQLREQLAEERQKWHAERKKLLIKANAKKPTETLALNLAHAIYGVPVNGLKALGNCESGRDPGAQNKDALGGSLATGYAQIAFNPRGIKSSTWHTTPFARLSPFDLTTNILAAGFIWKRNDYKGYPGFGEWRDYCVGRAARASGVQRITVKNTDAKRNLINNSGN